MKLYHEHVHIGKNTVYIGGDTICGFKHTLGVLQLSPTIVKEGLLYFPPVFVLYSQGITFISKLHETF